MYMYAKIVNFKPKILFWLMPFRHRCFKKPLSWKAPVSRSIQEILQDDMSMSDASTTKLNDKAAQVNLPKSLHIENTKIVTVLKDIHIGVKDVI